MVCEFTFANSQIPTGYYSSAENKSDQLLRLALHNIIDDHTIEVSISEDSDINSLIQDLSIKGIKVKSLKNKTSRLEELFMRLVDKNGK